MIHVSLVAAFPTAHPERNDGSIACRTLDTFRGILMNNPSYNRWEGTLNTQFYRSPEEAVVAIQAKAIASQHHRFAFVLVTDGSKSETWLSDLRQGWPKNAGLVLAISNPENFPQFAPHTSEDEGILSVDCAAVLRKSRSAHGALEYLAIRAQS